jgi:hypothetical protein
MRHAVASSPDSATIWEGFLSSVEARIGQESRSLSIETMANTVKCKYTLDDGTPGVTAYVSDADSAGLYGQKYLMVPLGDTTAAGALARANRVLATTKRPRATGTLHLATGALGDVTVTLTFAGWYTTLGWVLSGNSSTSIVDTGTQVNNLVSVALYLSDFLLGIPADIGLTGTTDTQFFEVDTTFRSRIETLLSMGGNAGASALAWGVYDDLQFSIAVCAEANPTTIHYFRRIGESVIRGPGGDKIAPWDIRPNKMYAVTELMDLNLSAIAPDAGGVSYISRVSLSIAKDLISLDLEGRTGDSVDRIVARMR